MLKKCGGPLVQQGFRHLQMSKSWFLLQLLQQLHQQLLSKQFQGSN